MGNIREGIVLRNLDVVSKALLLLFYVDDKKPIRRTTHLQKEMFVLGQKYDDLAEKTEFQPSFYGPDSEKVREAYDRLESLGLVSNFTFVQNDFNERIVQVVKQEKGFDMGDFSLLKHNYENMNNQELIAYIYSRYPEYITDSLIVSDFEKNRVKVAVSLYKKNVVSLSRALEIAGLT